MGNQWHYTHEVEESRRQAIAIEGYMKIYQLQNGFP